MKVTNLKLDEMKTFVLKQKELAIEKYQPIVMKLLDEYDVRKYL